MHRRATQTEATESEPTVVVRTEYMMLDWPEEVFVTEFGQCFHMRPDCDGLRKATGIMKRRLCKVCAEQLRPNRATHG